MIVIRLTALLLLLAGLSGCGAKTAAKPCPGSNPGFVQINIFYNSTTTSAPSVKIAHANDKLKFKLLGPPWKNVVVEGKEGDDHWIDKSGNNKMFIVCIPADLGSQDYEYSVDPEDSPLLDPVVRIL